MADFIDHSETRARDKEKQHLLHTLYQPLINAIALNPVTPPDVLTEIAYYAPKSLCANPALPDLLQSQPEWVKTLSGKALGEEGNDTVMRLLRCENAPRLLVEPLAEGKLVNNALYDNLIPHEAQGHIALSGESTDADWIREVDAFWHSYAQATSGSEREEHQELAIAGLLPYWAYGDDFLKQGELHQAQTRFQRAIDPTLLPEECAQLRADSSVAIQLAATINPATSESTRHRLAQVGIGEIFAFRNVSPMMSLLRKHPSLKTADDVRAACHEVLLHLLITNRELFVSHTKIHHRLLEMFIVIRRFPYILENPIHSQSVGEYWTLLLAWIFGVQTNEQGFWKNQDQACLKALSKDGNRWVRAAAKTRLKDSSTTLPW